MNSNETRLNRILNKMQKELVEIKDPMKQGVIKKQNRSLTNYQKNIKSNCNYILSRNNYKAYMAIDRYKKKKEKKGNEKETKWGFIETY